MIREGRCYLISGVDFYRTEKWGEIIGHTSFLDLPDVVGDELWVVELVVPVGGPAVELVVVVVLPEVLELITL